MDQKLNDQEQVRFNKLKALQKINKNPYEVTKIDRTHNSLTFKKEFDHFTK